MFRPFVFLGTASLALLCAIGIPGQLQAQRFRTMPPPPSLVRVPPGPGLTGPLLDPRLRMWMLGLDPRFTDPRFGRSGRDFDRHFMDPHFGGRFMDPRFGRFGRDFDRHFMDPRFRVR